MRIAGLGRQLAGQWRETPDCEGGERDVGAYFDKLGTDYSAEQGHAAGNGNTVL